MNPQVACFLRRVFWLLNKFFMVPAFRLGLGPLFGSPYGGYVMVIKNRGYKSGRIRYTPVNYAIAHGQVFCAAGFGKMAHWYKNIMADPQVELILPGGTISAQAKIANGAPDSLDIMRQVMKNSGFAAFLFGGFNPFMCSDERLKEITKDYILLRFRSTGIGSGPWDAGGWMWLWPLAGLALLIWLWLT